MYYDKKSHNQNLRPQNVTLLHKDIYRLNGTYSFKKNKLYK